MSCSCSSLAANTGANCGCKKCCKKQKCKSCVTVFCGATGSGGQGATGATGATGPIGPPGQGVETAFVQFWLRSNDAERYPLAPGEAVIFPETVTGPGPNSPSMRSDRRTIAINLQGTYLIQWSVAYDPLSVTFAGGALAGNIEFGLRVNGTESLPQLRAVQRSIVYQNQPSQPSFYIQATGIVHLQASQELQLISYSTGTIGQPAWSTRESDDVGASITLTRIGESIF